MQHTSLEAATIYPADSGFKWSIAFVLTQTGKELIHTLKLTPHQLQHKLGPKPAVLWMTMTAVSVSRSSTCVHQGSIWTSSSAALRWSL